MYALLFSEALVNRSEMRVFTREKIYSSALARGAAHGDKETIRAMMIGWWPFIQAFERAIDVRVGHLPIKPLVQRFGQTRIKAFFSEAREAVREMKEEEGSHAILWADGAKEFGLDLFGTHYDTLPSVQKLIANADSEDPVIFFSWLAAVEYIAEELAAYLCHAPKFTSLFAKKKWTWGLAHDEHEHDGPSHLEIDEDLARAYYPSNDPDITRAALTANMHECIEMFEKASFEIYATVPEMAH